MLVKSATKEKLEKTCLLLLLASTQYWILVSRKGAVMLHHYRHPALLRWPTRLCTRLRESAHTRKGLECWAPGRDRASVFRLFAVRPVLTHSWNEGVHTPRLE